ncbi:O-antigen ligase family protein [Zunongwangia endophytica]|uniref:O-antigen ligase family protein n=1 Tax=Zunongwangia endophytica TaxID=1808945 RepID=A0ABV8H931_9FLAO|nr:O-antigen ligase family protein [Zunongwangia endophytica]MDN3596244.1 O-antigen ligase family protein [Zunongwangia endophytica]
MEKSVGNIKIKWSLVIISSISIFLITFPGTKNELSSVYALLKGLIILIPLYFVPLYKFPKPKFFRLGICLALCHIITFTNKFAYMSQQLDMFMLELIIPLGSFFIFSVLRPSQISLFIMYLNIGLILACTPYFFGFLSNDVIDVESYDMKKYGASGILFTGYFKNIHNASITLSVSSIILLYRMKNIEKLWGKIVLGVIILFGLLCVYKTYVRTAWAMLGAAYLFNFLYSKKNYRRILRFISMSSLAVMALLYAFITSEVLQMRLYEKNVYDSSGLSVGSGRLVFWETMLQYLGTLDIVSFLFGTGRYSGMDYMQYAIGKRLFSHNGFLDVLVSSGFIGLFFFIFYIKSLFKYALEVEHYVVLWMLVIACIFQSHQIYWLLIIIAFLFAEIISKRNLHENYKY